MYESAHIKMNKSVYIAKSWQRYYKTLNNFLLYMLETYGYP